MSQLGGGASLTLTGSTVEKAGAYPHSHGYPSADANVTGWSSSPAIGYQAGVTDVGNHDVVCLNAVSGAGYAPRDASSTLPNPPAPAFVRPVDVVSGPAIRPSVFGNTFDGRLYLPA